MDLEEVKEDEEAGAKAGVLEEAGDGDGLGPEARVACRRPAFAPIAEQLFLAGEDCPVFRQDALTVARL